MGEIADLMIDGEICEGCGCELDGEAGGYPRRCFGCGGNTRDFDPMRRKTHKPDNMPISAKLPWWRTHEPSKEGGES